MHRVDQVSVIRWVCAGVAAVLLWTVGAATAAAQFGLPKINVPKLPGQKTTKTKAKKQVEPAGPPPEITAIEPNSGAPGSSGEVKLTGKNLNKKLGLALKSGSNQVRVTHFQVQSPEHATMVVAVPADAPEGEYSLEVTQYAEASVDADGETSLSGSPEVYAIPDTAPKFKVSGTGNLPVTVPTSLLGEGDMQYMDMMMKMQQAMMPGFGNQGGEGKILIASGSVKYVQGDKTVFAQPISAVKDLAEMKQGGQPIGIFRIVFTDGKIYNFFGGGQHGGDAHASFVLLKKKLGK